MPRQRKTSRKDPEVTRERGPSAKRATPGERGELPIPTAKGDLLFGIGDVHRGHIEKQLDDIGIYVRSLAGEVNMPSKHPTFVQEQLKKYPQS